MRSLTSTTVLSWKKCVLKFIAAICKQDMKVDICGVELPSNLNGMAFGVGT